MYCEISEVGGADLLSPPLNPPMKGPFHTYFLCFEIYLSQENNMFSPYSAKKEIYGIITK